MKACSYVIFTSMSKLSLDSQYMMWTVYRSLKTNSTASDGKMKLGAHPKGRDRNQVRSAWRLYTLYVRTWPRSADLNGPLWLVDESRFAHAHVQTPKFEKEGARWSRRSPLVSVSKSAFTQITWVWQRQSTWIWKRQVGIIIGNNRTGITEDGLPLRD